MRITRNWLREFADVDLDAGALSELLSDLGLEVEDVRPVGEVPEGVVVARVLDVRPHPDADRIRLVDVDPGDGGPLQICCGASNMSVGDLVALATVGTTMPDGMSIAARRMRGEESNGMLCSSRELGLGEDHDGILILQPGPLPGTALGPALGLESDLVVEVDVLPNRPDALSVLGVARDVAARLGLPFDVTRPDPVLVDGDLDGASVQVSEAGLCGRFAVCVLDDVQVGPSPSWMAARLEAAGMRPINVVVDTSNYVMLELGQPMHAFDLAAVPGGHLGVRRARAGERTVTLDGVERELREGDGVVVDVDDRVLAIAGVMGGSGTVSSPTPSSVIVEGAWWDPDSVEATSTDLGLHSEASLRFKRGVDTTIGRRALERVASLLVEYAGARVRPGLIEVLGELPEPAEVAFRPGRVGAVLGEDMDDVAIRSLLEPMGFECSGSGEVLAVRVPTWRPDCSEEIDLVEEVGRMHGLSRLPRTIPVIAQAGGLTEAQQRRRRIRSTLLGAGCDEAMPLPFLAPGDLERCGLPAVGLALANPLAAEESILRTSLLPGLLGAVAYNATHRADGVWLFEIGRVFEVGGGVIAAVDESARAGRVLDGEREHLGVALAGCSAGAAVRLLDAVVASVGVGPLVVTNRPVAGLHPGRSATVELAGVASGSVGEVHPDVLERHGIEERVAWLQLDLGVLLTLPSPPRQARPVSRFPSTDVDLAFVVGDEVPAAAVRTTVRGAGGDLVRRVRLFDVFRSDALGDGRRSLAFSVRFQADDRTLTDAEVAELRERIITEVSATHGAVLRG